MSFRDSDEVVQYIGGIFETAFGDPELATRLKATDIVLLFEFSDPDTQLVIDMPNGVVQEGLGDLEAGATMTMAADTGNAYWQGKENLPLAMAKGRIKVTGNVASLLRLAPLSKKLYPVYVDRLRQDGRDDLIVA
jgi:hypothetical protein